MHLPIHRTLVTTALLVVVAGCATGTGTPQDATTTTEAPGAEDTDGLRVVPASFDLAVGDDARLLVGLLTADQQLVLGGEVRFELFHLGSDGQQEPDPAGSADATFVPVPGKEPSGLGDAPTVVPPADASGVYEARVDLDRAGLWGVGVVAEVDGEQLRGTATFAVNEQPLVPGVGDPAPRVPNRTLETDGPLVALDSRAQGPDGQVPDPQLHDATVVDAIEQGRPVVVTVATPTYCVSQFCGPLVETIEELEEQYGDVAEFVHLEVWEDFDGQVLNAAAAAWIQTAVGGNEPWVFLVDADGIVQARWGNVLDQQALVEQLEAL